MKSRRRSVSREERLKRRRDFALVFSEGKGVSDRRLVVHARPNGLPFNRVGFAVGKRHGNAVTRNRLRRLLREAYRTQKPRLPQGYDVVVVPRQGCPDDLEVLRGSIASLLHRVPDVFTSRPKPSTEEAGQ